MKIKAVSQQTGLTQKTIRFYESVGLITPNAKTINGRAFRDYSEADIAQLKEIAVLRKARFSIEEILHMQEDPQAVQEIFSDYYSRMKQEMSEMKQLVSVLDSISTHPLPSKEALVNEITTVTEKLSLPAIDVRPHFRYLDLLEEKLKEVMTSERGNFRFMEPMKRHTTFRIGGPAAVFISPGSEEELREVLNLLKEENIPWTILGNGSNLLVSDEGFKGAVISMSEGWAYSGVLREDEKAGKTLIRAGAGELLSRTARLAMECSLTGMEFASGIPGTIGGALVMNAGAYGSEICNVLSRAKVMTTEGEILELPAEELELGYRTSCIPKKNYIVLEAVFELNKGSKEAISSQMRELAGKRREKQPLEYPSAGSTFKRPEGYFAAKLIEDAGLKGFSVGGAMVSEKHSGFVINYNDATASDVMELCRQVREKVKALSGVELEMEVKRLGEFK